MAPNRREDPETSPAKAQGTVALEGPKDIAKVREELGNEAVSQTAGSEAEAAECHEAKAQGKLLIFPNNFSLLALQKGASPVGEDAKSNRNDHENSAGLKHTPIAKRRSTLKRLLKRRAKINELESFLRDRFKQMVLAEMMQRKPEPVTGDPAQQPDTTPPDIEGEGTENDKNSDTKTAARKSAFENSRGLKYRSALQRAAVQKAQKPSTRAHLTRQPPKKPKR